MASRAHLPGNKCGQVGRGQEHKFSGCVQGDKSCGKGRNIVTLPGLHPTVEHSVLTCIGYLCVRVCVCLCVSSSTTREAEQFSCWSLSLSKELDTQWVPNKFPYLPCWPRAWPTSYPCWGHAHQPPPAGDWEGFAAGGGGSFLVSLEAPNSSFPMTPLPFRHSH